MSSIAGFPPKGVTQVAPTGAESSAPTQAVATLAPGDSIDAGTNVSGLARAVALGQSVELSPDDYERSLAALGRFLDNVA